MEKTKNSGSGHQQAMRRKRLSMNIRWKRWLAGAAGVLAAYTAVGFWLVPLVIEREVPKFGRTELARQASIGKVRFNPYTLRLQAQDLRLAEADGAPLFAIEKLAVELQWKSLLRRAWSFAEIHVSAPSVNLAIAPDGKFNLAELLATLARRPREPAADTSLPRLNIARFTLERGKVEIHDRRAGYADTVSPIEFALHNFSTLAGPNDSYTLTADSARGGKLRWTGTASLNPIRGSGELSLEQVSLPGLAVYLKPYTPITLTAGQFAAVIPYRFAYSDGKFQANLDRAKLALHDLALARGDDKGNPFATLAHLDVSGISADLARRDVSVEELRAGNGKLALKRDAKGELNLANLLVKGAPPPAAPTSAAPVVVDNWKLALKHAVVDQMAISAIDATVNPPLKLNADQAQLRLQLAAEQADAHFNLTIAGGAFSLANLTLASGAQTPFKLAQAGFADAALNLSARQFSVGRVYAEGGQLQLRRDSKGQLNLLQLLPRFPARGQQPAAPAPAANGAPWTAVAKVVEISKFGAAIEDQGTGVKFNVQNLAAKLEGASSDPARPVKFNAGLKLREGGELSAQGTATAKGALDAKLRVRRLALAPLQPLLGKYLKLKIAGGDFSAQGQLTAGAGRARQARLRYVGGVDIAGLVLNEEDGDRFAAWKSVGAEKLSASVEPNAIDIPELRVVEPDAKLLIESDHSLNAARLLVQPRAAGATERPPPASASPAQEPFKARIGRLRVTNAKLDFTDLSLRPQFSAKIHELNGVVTGLASKRDSRAQVELDGRVDEFGSARFRGELNPFAPRDNTDINVVFKNVDLVPATPYSMKFAGYKVAKGKISLDLQYKVRNGELVGNNQIVIDNLTLGERVESPDALKLPLELAIAVLKDNDGRIDLGLPISGDLSDPQFSYGAVIWKAITNVLTKIVTAPFRALGKLFGISGEKLQAIDFDPGSDRVLPPEREKLDKLAQLLSKRAQLKLAVPGQYSEAADGAALRARAVRIEIAKRAGIKLETGEDPGPLDFQSRAVRSAVRDLYAERFGAPELEKQKKAAESAAAATAGATSAQSNGPAQGKLSTLQRLGKFVQGEPQVADSSAFYHALLDRLDQNQALPPDALTRLGAQRASAIVAVLKGAGIDPARASAGAPEEIGSSVGKPVPLTLGLATK